MISLSLIALYPLLSIIVPVIGCQATMTTVWFAYTGQAFIAIMLYCYVHDCAFVFK